jgi:hypothetical protein
MELAEKEGRTFTELVEEAAAMLIKEREATPSPAGKVDLPVFQGELPVPEGMTIEQWIKELQEQDDRELMEKIRRGHA